MKSVLALGLYLWSLPVVARTTDNDTTIKGVRINFAYSYSIFPTSWQGAPISARGEQISAFEIKRSKAIMMKALSKYPATALAKDLRAVYFLKSMRFYDVGYGGTNSTDALYLTNNGSSAGYTDLYIEQTFHHEYSSILYRRHASFLDQSAWMDCNTLGFDYDDPENGVGAIRNNKSSQELDTVICIKGFLTQYSLSGMENDLNTFAQNLFSPSEGFWSIVDSYPRINKKVKLLIAFYNKIDPVFTEEYFRKFSR